MNAAVIVLIYHLKNLYKPLKQTEQMRTKKRRFYHGSPQHIYQRTIGGVNIFYDVEDYLVFFTIFSTSSKKFNVKILEQCIMIDHIHSLIESEDKKTMSDFVCHYTSTFVREYNHRVGRRGRLIEKAFGNAPKKQDKKIRSAILYILNNPVEKEICKSAKDYRWNFLAFARSTHPFSVKINKDKASKPLRRAMKEVREYNEDGRFLRYSQLQRMFKYLHTAEKEMLIDFIISTYSTIDYQELLKYYDNYEALTIAADSSSGSEYDVKETFYPHSDCAYREMMEYLKKEKGMTVTRRVTTLPMDEKISLARELQLHCRASNLQVRKFLHLTTEENFKK